MATPRFLHLSRRLATITTTAKSSLSAASAAAQTPRFSLLRTLSAVRLPLTAILPSSSTRLFSTQIETPSVEQCNPPPKRRPKEKILLDGCDLEHWLIVLDPLPEDWSRDQIIDFYVKTLAEVVGSEEEARKKMYSVSTKHYFTFGALMDEETSAKFKEMKNIQWVLPDSYSDLKTKDYGGEPFINGQAVPYDPKYHAEWVRNTERERVKNMGGDSNQPGDSPNNAEHGQNIPPGNSGDQQNMSLNNASYQQDMPPNNAGHGENIPPKNMSSGGYGGGVISE